MATAAAVQTPERIIYQPGLEGTPLENCVRYSWLSEFARSPLHCWSRYLNPERPDDTTDARRLGSATHCAILEPEAFDSRYVVAPAGVDRSSTAGIGAYIKWAEDLVGYEALGAIQLAWSTVANIEQKRRYLDALIAADGRIVLTADEAASLEAMAAAVYRHPKTSVLMPDDDALIETTLVWADEETGVICRGTPDYMIPPCEPWPDGLVMDMKTTRDASHRSFQRDAYTMGYHRQSAVYADAVQAIWRTSRRPVWAWLAVEKERPYGVAYYAATDDQIEAGRRSYRALLPAVRDCLVSGKWPGYAETFEDLGLPAWAAKQEEGR